MGALDRLDLTNKIRSKSDYKKGLKPLQIELLFMQRYLLETRRNVIMIFEGPDAAGKGGCIKRLVEKLDPRCIRVYSIIKPTPEELQRHYLWRFWKRVPAYGQMVIFDRSWYGRVLVERVEGFATKEEWRRAYAEINNFEKNLVDDGSILIKFYLQISKKEQLRRFEERQADPLKHWKINDEDWRNREKWSEHTQAADEMIRRTNTKYAPWNLIEAEYKWFARLKILRIANRIISKELGVKYDPAV
jgi:polyphosphate kinase 2 (PPK2 family)